MRDDGLTDDEGEVMDNLCAAVDAFERLKPRHPDAYDEFFDGVHRLQDLLAAQAMARMFSQGWVNGNG